MERKSLCFIFAVIVLFSQYAVAYAELFGPTKYARTTGSPNTYHDSFSSCNTGATYKLSVENGESGKNGVSSGTISLNGQKIINQNDFSQKIEKIEKTVSLRPENILDIKLSSGPTGFIRASISCVANCLGIKITFPVTTTTINKSQTIIRGDLYNAFSETGVVLQSLASGDSLSTLAQTQGRSFAGISPLQPGQNTITATASDACGYKTTDSIIVSTDTAQEIMRLSTYPSSGISPLSITLEAEAYSLNPVSNYEWDTKGIGTPDQSGPLLSKVTTTFQNPGLYFPTVTITDDQGNAYTETTVINVVSREDMDALLKGKWNEMKTALSGSDIEGAMTFFAERSKNSFRQQFNALTQSLPQIVADMGAVNAVDVKDGLSEYGLRTVRNGTTYSFQLLFEKDTDGIWRIRSF